MWFLLYLRGRRNRRRRQAQPGVALLVFGAAFAGVLLGGMLLGVAFTVAGILLVAASSA